MPRSHHLGRALSIKSSALHQVERSPSRGATRPRRSRGCPVPSRRAGSREGASAPSEDSHLSETAVRHRRWLPQRPLTRQSAARHLPTRASNRGCDPKIGLQTPWSEESQHVSQHPHRHTRTCDQNHRNRPELASTMPRSRRTVAGWPAPLRAPRPVCDPTMRWCYRRVSPLGFPRPSAGRLQASWPASTGPWASSHSPPRCEPFEGAGDPSACPVERLASATVESPRSTSIRATYPMGCC